VRAPARAGHGWLVHAGCMTGRCLTKCLNKDGKGQKVFEEWIALKVGWRWCPTVLIGSPYCNGATTNQLVHVLKEAHNWYVVIFTHAQLRQYCVVDLHVLNHAGNMWFSDTILLQSVVFLILFIW
jgi:predicted aconitase